MIALSRSRPCAPRRGAAAVEMALVAPVFIVLILGTLEVARIGMVSQLLTNAAREGCRVAVLEGKTQSDVKARVDQMLSGSGITVATVAPTPSNWATSPAGTAITLNLSVPYKNVTWIGNPLNAFKDTQIKASATMSSERP